MNQNRTISSSTATKKNGDSKSKINGFKCIAKPKEKRANKRNNENDRQVCHAKAGVVPLISVSSLLVYTIIAYTKVVSIEHAVKPSGNDPTIEKSKARLPIKIMI